MTVSEGIFVSTKGDSKATNQLIIGVPRLNLPENNGKQRTKFKRTQVVSDDSELDMAYSVWAATELNLYLPEFQPQAWYTGPNNNVFTLHTSEISADFECLNHLHPIYINKKFQAGADGNEEGICHLGQLMVHAVAFYDRSMFGDYVGAVIEKKEKTEHWTAVKKVTLLTTSKEQKPVFLADTINALPHLITDPKKAGDLPNMYKDRYAPDDYFDIYEEAQFQVTARFKSKEQKNEFLRKDACRGILNRLLTPKNYTKGLISRCTPNEEIQTQLFIYNDALIDLVRKEANEINDFIDYLQHEINLFKSGQSSDIFHLKSLLVSYKARGEKIPLSQTLNFEEDFANNLQEVMDLLKIVVNPKKDPSQSSSFPVYVRPRVNLDAGDSNVVNFDSFIDMRDFEESVNNVEKNISGLKIDLDAQARPLDESPSQKIFLRGALHEKAEDNMFLYDYNNDDEVDHNALPTTRVQHNQLLEQAITSLMPNTSKTGVTEFLSTGQQSNLAVSSQLNLPGELLPPSPPQGGAASKTKFFRQAQNAERTPYLGSNGQLLPLAPVIAATQTPVAQPGSLQPPVQNTLQNNAPQVVVAAPVAIPALVQVQPPVPPQAQVPAHPAPIVAQRNTDVQQTLDASSCCLIL